MNQERLQSLIQRRDQLADHAAAMAALPADARPSKPSELKAWTQELEFLRGMVDQIDKLLERAAPKLRVGVPDLVAAPNSESGDVVTVARVPKGKRAEVRVSVKPWQGRRVVDIRLWSFIAGAGDEMRPSRKGIAFDAAKLDALIEALHLAKQHV